MAVNCFLLGHYLFGNQALGLGSGSKPHFPPEIVIVHFWVKLGVGDKSPWVSSSLHFRLQQIPAVHVQQQKATC